MEYYGLLMRLKLNNKIAYGVPWNGSSTQQHKLCPSFMVYGVFRIFDAEMELSLRYNALGRTRAHLAFSIL